MAQVTYVWGAETYSPVQYNSFTVGPFSMTVEIEPGETATDALNRARKLLEPYAAKRFEKKRDAYYARLQASKEQ